MDRRLGFIYCSVVLLVFFYIIVGVFIVRQGHLDTEKTMGWILTKADTPGHWDEQVPFDIFDAVTSNPAEQGAAFIPTRVVVTKGQADKGDFCPSPVHTCKQDDDCDIGNPELQKPKCEEGMCMRRQWCPAENPHGSASEVHYNSDYANVELWYQTYVHFHKFMVDVSTADEDVKIAFPNKGANTIALHDILRIANINAKEVRDNGAVMLMNAVYNCNLDAKTCDSTLESMNVDTKSGYNTVHNHYYVEGGVRKRDSYHMYGVRVVAFATGLGSRTSLSMIVLQISSGMALLTLGRSFADFCLRFLLPQSKHYTEQKVKQAQYDSD